LVVVTTQRLFITSMVCIRIVDDIPVWNWVGIEAACVRARYATAVPTWRAVT
jgi:hypothetical protein